MKIIRIKLIYKRDSRGSVFPQKGIMEQGYKVPTFHKKSLIN